MKNDQLEKFILDNREAFDDAVPSLDVWAAIDCEVHPGPKVRWKVWKTLRIAAAVAVLLVIGAVGGRYLSQPLSQNIADIIQDVNPEFLEAEQFYQGQIQQKVAQLTGFDGKEDVLADLKQLDQVQKELKKELQNAPKGKEQEIVETLIQNYQIKIAILERVLERVNQENNVNLEDDEIIM